MTKFEELMAQLHTEYLDSLPDKLNELESSVKLGEIEGLREDFHKLKGTGKTYGFPEISQVGELVERVLLQQPNKFSQIVPVAISLLRKIHQERQISPSFDLDGDGRFNEIRALAQ